MNFFLKLYYEIKWFIMAGILCEKFRMYGNVGIYNFCNLIKVNQTAEFIII